MLQMPNNHNNGELLNTWKEIAQYLDSSIRTCRRWEIELGLPVHRIRDSVKSRVYAYQDELDEWLKKKKEGNHAEAAHISHNKYLKVLFVILVLIFLGVTIAAFKNFILNKNSSAANFHLNGSKLIIVDQNDKRVGEYDTGIDNLIDENSYRFRFQSSSNVVDKTSRVFKNLPFLTIQDLDGDESPEILLSIQTKTEAKEGVLLCLNEKGKKLWEYKVGREIQYGPTVYSSDFRIIGFMVYDFNADGLKEIVLTSAHRYDFPSQIVILDNEGRVKGEYWNSGYLNRCEVADLDKDGRMELLLAGCNNEYKKGCLVVFDPENMNGGSPQSEDFYSCAELAPGKEKFYILFPRTDFDDATTTQESISCMDILNNETVSLIATNSQIIFELGFDMKLSRVRTSHRFQNLYRQAKQDGRVSGEIDDLYRQNLERSLLYFDGQNWTSTPTMTSYGKNKASSH
jgi:hypothetical protein